MKRLFAAIKIHPSPRYISLFNEISSSLGHERIKWIEPENTHLTLKFFGETDETKIPVIRQSIETVVAQSKPFSLKIANTGIFGSHYDPKVIWFGIEKNSILEDLAQNIFTELSKYGWEQDRQNFIPHLTIGRIKELKDKPLFQKIIGKYNTIAIQEEKVTEIILYESILRREGPLYANVFSVVL
ncbi:MAG: RNA 2',3'-cyclic phosphodiesterase [Bacteroidales bacterium]|nr:RNA 2',3'-cyclic phosphodiesterase [Bacteroidales bacterium]